MSRDLGRDVPDLEKLYARKLWADFSYPTNRPFWATKSLLCFADLKEKEFYAKTRSTTISDRNPQFISTGIFNFLQRIVVLLLLFFTKDVPPKVWRNHRVLQGVAEGGPI